MTFQQALDRLRERSQVPLLASQVWDRTLDEALLSASQEELFPRKPLSDARMAAGALQISMAWQRLCAASKLSFQRWRLASAPAAIRASESGFRGNSSS